MTLLHRYIFRSVLFTSLASVGLFVFILLAGRTLKDIVGLLAAGRLSGQMFVELMLLLIPYMVSYALPLGMLTGLLLVLGRLSAQREIVALKAAGVSIWYIGAPIFALALLGVVLSGAINCYYAPHAKTRYRARLAESVREDPLRYIVPKTFIHDFPGYVIYAGEKSGQTLKDFWIWELDEEKRAVKVLRARSGQFHYDAEGDALVLTLEEGFTELRSETNPDDFQTIRPTISFSEAKIRLPLDKLLVTIRRTQRLSDMDIGQLLKKRSNLALQLERLDAGEDSEVRAGLEAEKMKTQVQLQKNLAMAFSILSLTLIGIPIGIRVSRSETHANIGLALILALTYYFLMIMVGWLDRNPALRPDLLVWLPNILYQSLGVWLLVRANRH